jgi:two-component system, sensor histidine kinase YesM
MKIRNFRFIYNSISFKIFLIIIVILAPLISLLIYNNYQARESLLDQVKGTHRNMLQTYLIQIDAQLKNSMGYTLDMALFQNDPKILIDDTDESTIAFAKNRVFTSLSNRLISNNLIDAFFLYVEHQDYFIIVTQHGVSSSELEELKKYVVLNYRGENTANTFPKSTWNFTQVDKRNSLINLSNGNNGIIAGAYTSTDRLLNSFVQEDFTNLNLSFIPTTALGAEANKLPQDTLLISGRSSVSNISLVEYLPEKKVLNDLPFIQKYILVVSIFLILMLPILILLMKLIVVNPLQKLTKSMHRIRSGDLMYRINIKRSSNEFQIVNITFNKMMDDLQHLKIDVYEEKIKAQKSQLRNLQLQIKPHFLINSLNMVNNLIQNENLASARDLILHSVDYFRYMSKAENDFVPLNEEIKHVTDYLEIQKLRYKDKFTYSININQLIEDMLVPPMLIQNFVENSIKYAIEMSKLIHISIKVEYFEVDYYPYAKIIITDTSMGYPTDILERLNSGKKITDSLGEHIGIYNSVQRMRILYEGKARWKFYNDSGAVSELNLPALFDSTNE